VCNGFCVCGSDYCECLFSKRYSSVLVETYIHIYSRSILLFIAFPFIIFFHRLGLFERMDCNASVDTVNTVNSSSNNTKTSHHTRNTQTNPHAKYRKVGKPSVASQESLSALSEPKSQAHILQHLSRSVHKNLAGNFAMIERESAKSVDRIQVMLQAAEQFNLREASQSTMYGYACSNHISRLEPMQHNNSDDQSSMSTQKLKRREPRYKYEKATLPPPSGNISHLHPDWNGRFVYGDCLNTNTNSALSPGHAPSSHGNPHKLPKLDHASSSSSSSSLSSSIRHVGDDNHHPINIALLEEFRFSSSSGSPKNANKQTNNSDPTQQQQQGSIGDDGLAGDAAKEEDEVEIINYTQAQNMIATYLFQKLPKKRRKKKKKSKANDNSSKYLQPLELEASGAHGPQDYYFTPANIAIYERNKISWESLLADFRAYAEKHISIKDLYEIANLRDPPSVYMPLFVYLCHLFGLSPPSWAACKKYIFKEVSLLRRFLVNVSFHWMC
jgi:hypothetical protein